MKLAARILHMLEEVGARSDREALDIYQNLPGLRDTPYEAVEWDAMSKRLTLKWAKLTKCAINFSGVHFELDRAYQRNAQLPKVERMIDLAFQKTETLKKIRRTYGKFSMLQAHTGKTYDAPNAQFGRDFAKRGGLGIRSLSLKISLVGEITGELPSWATKDCKQSWKFLTCSNKPTFVFKKGDEVVIVENNQEIPIILVEVE